MSISTQHNALKRVNHRKFWFGQYRYRLIYEGGFINAVRLDRKIPGKRFQKYKIVPCFDCYTWEDAFDKCLDYVMKHNSLDWN